MSDAIHSQYADNAMMFMASMMVMARRYRRMAVVRRFGRLRRLGWLVVFLPAAAFGAACPTPAHAHETTSLFRIATGGLTGVYFPIGQLIAQGLTGASPSETGTPGGDAGIPGYIGVAQTSAGSLENARALIAGEVEAGLVQADVAAKVHRSQHPPADDKEPAPTIRAMASLYPEVFQLVTRRDAGIRVMGDLRGKRISIDEIGSGTLEVVRIMLSVHGLTETDFSPVYLKPAFTHGRMIRGELHGFAMMAGVPMEAITQLAGIDLHIVPIAPIMAERVHAQAPHLVPGLIPAGVYPGVPETPTVQVHALLVVRGDLDDGLVYQATAALWSPHTRSLLDHGHPQGRAIVLGAALKGLSIPLHPGAARFYREKGMLP